MTDSTNETLGEEVMTWLEQFEATAKSSLPSIEAVVKQGLTEIENEALVQFAAKLIKLAEVHNPEALNHVNSLVNNQ